MAEAIPDVPPPDPNPRQAKFAVPAGACDTHAHVFGPASRYPYSPTRGYTPPDAALASWRAMHKALGIERGVLVQASVYGTDNRAVVDAVATDPARLRAVVSVGADVTEREIERLDKAGARGIRVNIVDKGGMPFASWSELERVAAMVRAFGWHVEFLVHVHELEDIATKFGTLGPDVVVGHLGYMRSSEGLENAGFRRFLDFLAGGRCWVKLTAPYRITVEQRPPYADIVPFGRRIVATRPDRMLWGSDWPHVFIKIPMPNDGELLDTLGDWAQDEAVRKGILVDNPAKLYGFKS